MRVLAILLALLLSSCAVERLKFWESGPEFQSAAVKVREMRRALLCGTPTEDPVVRLFDDVAALRAWDGAERLHLETLDLPEDLAYVLVEQGLRRTGGYSIELNRRGRLTDEGVLQLQAEWLEPAEDRMVTQIMTSLCVLVGVPKLPYRRVELSDSNQVIRAAHDYKR